MIAFPDHPAGFFRFVFRRPRAASASGRSRLFRLLAAWLLCPLLLLAEAPSASLISNGDFRQDNDADGWPDDWKRGDAGTRWENEDGTAFLRLQPPAPGQRVAFSREIALPEGGKGVDFVIRHRTNGIKRGDKQWADSRVIFQFLSAEKTVIAPDPSPMSFGDNQPDWKDVRRQLVTPPGATTLRITPCLNHVASGTLDVTSIRITAMPDAEVEALVARRAALKTRAAERAALFAKDLALPSITTELKVEGNQVMTTDGRPIWLQGLSLDSMQWSHLGENMQWSMRVAIDDWKANVIRLPVHDTYWFGKGKSQPAGGAEAYRKTVDELIHFASTRGAWVLLDLHQFGAPTEAHVAFWKDAAMRYRNHPAVLFEIFNETHGITWELWRDGGSLKDVKHSDVNPTENTLKTEADWTPGMQALVKAIRDTGAKNIILAGGLDWAYDLSGIANGFALDDLGGNGIIYVSHIYPWKKDWQDKVLVVADQHPIIVTEIGCPRRWEDFAFIPPAQRYPLEGWSEDVLGMIQKYKLHWTGFSFHPSCGPQLLLDWDYTPTPYWGVFVKEALQGQPFEMKAMR